MLIKLISIFGAQNTGFSVGLSGGSGNSGGTGNLAGLDVLNFFLDLNNLKGFTVGSLSRTDNVLFFDANEPTPYKTKKVAINKLLSDSYQTFIGKGSKVVVEKGTDTVQFDVATGEVSSSNQNLITGATAFAYIQQNTVSTFDGKTGNITVVDGGTY